MVSLAMFTPDVGGRHFSGLLFCAENDDQHENEC